MKSSDSRLPPPVLLLVKFTFHNSTFPSCGGRGKVRQSLGNRGPANGQFEYRVEIWKCDIIDLTCFIEIHSVIFQSL